MPLLARLGVGAKLTLLVFLPVGVLLAFTIGGAVDDWRNASARRDFRTATEQSEDRVATALADERAATTLARLRPGPSTARQLRTAKADVDVAFRQATARAATWHGSLDLSGRLDAAWRQLNAARVQVASGSLTAPQSADAYSTIVSSLLGTVRQLDATAPTRSSAQAADAYVAIGMAIEAAAQERVDVATLIATRPTASLPAVHGRLLEDTELDVFRENATGPLAADLAAVLYSPAGVTVSAVRDDLDRNGLAAVPALSLERWLRASGSRIASFRRLQAGARANLAAVVSNDVGSARTHGFQDLGLSVAVLLLVVGLALALRRSITRPLSEVSQGAQDLSSGNLTFDVGYRGRDEIGHVASAFRTMRETVERLAGEIRGMTAAVTERRLEHRANVDAFEGTWSQLLAGLNDTMAAFTNLESRREHAEKDLADFFELSLDMLCIANVDGYFTRVNPAFERTLGYTSDELLSRPYLEFIHPDDRAGTAEVAAALSGGHDTVGFENRYVRADGSVCWLQWSTRALPDEGLLYAVARDVTERRRSEQEQAALRRVATLVAEGASPAETFSAVAAEVGQLVDADAAVVFRRDAERSATIVGGWSVPGIAVPLGSRLAVTGAGVAMRVLETHGPARVERFEGPPGSVAAFLADLGTRAGVGAPITVEGRLWGVMIAGSRREDAFPAETEERLAAFTELVATAIANAHARDELRAVAEEQAALRRVATLVAAGVPPEDVFAAVAAEVGQLLPAAAFASVGRYAADGTVAFAGTWSPSGEPAEFGTLRLGGHNAATLVYEQERPVRIDRYSDASEVAEAARAAGLRSSVGAPISVAGTLWGVMIVNSAGEEAFAAGTEMRMAEFTELLGTAIANAEAQGELTTSRAQIEVLAEERTQLLADALEAEQRERRSLAEALHDHALQNLLSARQDLDEALEATAHPALDRARTALVRTTGELRDAVFELHPYVLEEAGLQAAVRSLAEDAAGRAGLDLDLDLRYEGRHPREPLLFSAARELISNVVRHSGASRLTVRLVDDTGGVELAVEDDGHSFALDRLSEGLAEGHVGLASQRVRIEAAGGSIRIEAAPGSGTRVAVWVPG